MLIESTPLARPLVNALYRRVVQAGGHPEVRIGLDGAVEALLAGGNDEQLGWISPRLRGDAKEATVRIAIEAESNTRAPDRHRSRAAGDLRALALPPRAT